MEIRELDGKKIAEELKAQYQLEIALRKLILGGDVELSRSAANILSLGSGDELRLLTTDKLGFRDAAIYIRSPADAGLEIASDGYVLLSGADVTNDNSLILEKHTITTNSTDADATVTAAEILGGYYVIDATLTANRTLTTDTAANIVGAISGATADTAFRFLLKNDTSGAYTITLAAGTGVTLTGTATITQGSTREFLIVLTNVGSGTEAVTIYSLAEGTH